MDNLEEFANEEDRRSTETPYAVEAVPWVSFFSEGYGLHATYWHNSFGIKKSHGCVNLSLADAERLFNFVSPRLNAGWQAALPTDYDRGTVIRIR
jgi:lipoprotein-anchoring transpeptidase ErfK/SrfK